MDPVSITYEESYTFLPDQLVSMDLTGTGGSGVYLWALPEVEESSNALFTVDANGVVTPVGTLAEGTYKFCVTVTDANDPTSSFTTKLIILTIAAAEESTPEAASLDEGNAE